MSIFRHSESISPRERPKTIGELGYLDLRYLENGQSRANISDITDHLPHLAEEFKREFESSVIANKEKIRSGEKVKLAEVKGLPVYRPSIFEDSKEEKKKAKIGELFSNAFISSRTILESGIFIDNWVSMHPVGRSPTVEQQLEYLLETNLKRVLDLYSEEDISFPAIDSFIALSSHFSYYDTNDSELYEPYLENKKRAAYSSLTVTGEVVILTIKAIEEINKRVSAKISRRTTRKALKETM